MNQLILGRKTRNYEEEETMNKEDNPSQRVLYTPPNPLLLEGE
jgi:hypothetical protein